MTSFGDYDEQDVADARPSSAGARRVATWIVVGLLALIVVNIGIAAVGGPAEKPPPAPPAPTAPPTPAPTASPSGTSSAPPTEAPLPRPTPGTGSGTPVPIPLESPLPTLPAPTAGASALIYAGTLGALTPDGDIVLVSPATGTIVAPLVAHEPGSPVRAISWDGARGVMWFDRTGACPTVWRFQQGTARPQVFAHGRHPVVSPDGTKVAVIGTGCGTSQQIAEGAAVYSTETGQPVAWFPTGFDGLSDPPALAGVVDIDWRPDSAAIAVTVQLDNTATHKIMSLEQPNATLASAPDIPVGAAGDESYYQLEYAADRLLLLGTCCSGGGARRGARLAETEGNGGPRSVILETPVVDISANEGGDIMFLAAEVDPETPEGGRLRALHRGASSGAPGAPELFRGPAIGTESFVRIDW